jgi:hypothetical protein
MQSKHNILAMLVKADKITTLVISLSATRRSHKGILAKPRRGVMLSNRVPQEVFLSWLRQKLFNLEAS